MLLLIVVDGKGPSLFGRNWLQKLQLNWGAIQRVDATSAVNLLHEYADVFAPGLGNIKGVTAHLDVKDGTAPIFLKPLSVPYTL